MCMLDIARSYRDAGFSVVPIEPDGTKRPACPWKQYQDRKPTDAELHYWFGVERYGIAVICGQISGGLEVLDFDSPEAFTLWRAMIEAKAPGLLATLPQVQTPKGGMHVYVRSDKPRGNQKLARDENGQTLIETRGEGGYVLAPGCPAACHSTGKSYVHVAGPAITETPLFIGNAKDEQRVA